MQGKTPAGNDEIISSLWLGVIFVVLKLFGFVSWPWIWVTAPLWGLAVIIIVCLIFCWN
jgi:membrane protein insertase Oxa1/YidC/SpoIIIJ